jgi:hypothetical protein
MQVQKEMEMTKRAIRQEKRFVNIMDKEEIDAENTILKPVEALSCLIRRYQKKSGVSLTVGLIV